MNLTFLNLVALMTLQTYVAAHLPGTLHFDITRSKQQLPRKRDDTAAATLANELQVGLYLINATIGTPPQAVSLQLDSGSSDTWVVSSNNTACQGGQCILGKYNMSASSTAQEYLPEGFSISYADGTGASGDYITDDFSFGGVTIPNLTTGLAYQSNRTFGLMGVGLPFNEAAVTENFTAFPNISQAVPAEAFEYPNVPLALAQNNITRSAAFSLWLNDLDASTGSILFGGIDTAKYKENLTLLDLVPALQNGSEKIYYKYMVMLSGLSAVSSTGADVLGSSSFPTPAHLDAGTSLTNLPADLVAEIYAEVGATVGDEGYAEVDCDIATSETYFAFELGGPGGALINVTLNELVSTVAGTQDGKCIFGISAKDGGDSEVILGDTFLRSAYVVYDLVNHQVAIANTNFNTTESNVVPFQSYGAPVPSATYAKNSDNLAALNGSAVTATATSFPAASGFAHPAVSSSSSLSSSSSAASSSATNSAPANSGAVSYRDGFPLGLCSITTLVMACSGWLAILM